MKKDNFLEYIIKFIKYFVIVTVMILMIQITLKSFCTIDSRAGFIKRNIEYIVLPIGVGVVVLSMFVFAYASKIRKLDNNRLRIHIIGLSTILLVIQMIVVVCFDIMPTTDNYLAIDLASALAEGKASNLAHTDTLYFSIYGNMYFYTLFLSYIFKIASFFKITNYIKIAVVVNLVLVDCSVALGYQIIKRIFSKQNAVLYLCLIVLNPTFYLVLPWTYTASYSMPLFMGVIYFGIVFYQTKSQRTRIFSIIAIAVVSVIGYFLRPTVLIATIGVAFGGMVLFIQAKARRKQLVISFAIFLVVAASTYFGESQIIKSYHPDTKKNCPITHWIMMGMHGDGRVNSADNSYTGSFPTKEAKIEGNKKKIKEYWTEQGVTGYLKTLYKKLNIVWTDGANAYYVRMGQDRDQSKLYSYAVDDKKDFMILYCQTYQTFIYIFITYSLVRSLLKERRNLIFILQLILFGAILFYLIWEAKEAYSIPFAGLLVMLGVTGIDDRLERKRNVHRNTYFICAAMLVTITSIGIISKYSCFTKKEVKNYQYSVNCCDPSSFMNYITNIAKQKREIQQEFYAKHEFNSITLHGRKIASNGQVYEIDLYNENNEKCKTFSISENDVNKNEYIDLVMENMPGAKKYYLRIRAKDPYIKDSIGFGYRKSMNTSQYDGTLLDIKSNKSEVSDLFVKVYEKKRGVYLSKNKYIAAGLFVLLLELLVSLKYYNQFICKKDEAVKELPFCKSKDIIT